MTATPRARAATEVRARAATGVRTGAATGVRARAAITATALALAVTVAGCGATGPASPSGPASPAGPATPQAPSGPGCPKPATVIVHTATELTTALVAATPGAVIQLADGGYPGGFTAKRSGTAQAPITLCGGRAAVIDGGRATYSLYLNGASYWQVIGFTVRGGDKGVMVDNANDNLFDSLEITNVQAEGIHLRRNSSDNVIRGNLIHDTGQLQPEFGEGVYVGSARGNWCRYTDCQPDRADRNLIEHNTISRTTAESVDIKEGTTGGVVRENNFTGPTPNAESWVNVKGNGWRIVGNTGHGSDQDGFSVHQILDGWGIDNTFDANTAVVDGPGYGINITKNKDRNRVTCSNKAEGAGKGLSNTNCA